MGVPPVGIGVGDCPKEVVMTRIPKPSKPGTISPRQSPLRKAPMAFQRGSLKQVPRKEGETWMLRYRVMNAEGRRVEHTLPVGLVRDFPSEKAAWREVDRLGLAVRINEAPDSGRIRFDQLAEHYLKADFGPDAVRPKSEGTVLNINHIVRDILVPRFGQENRGGYQTAGHPALAKIAAHGQGTCLDNGLEDTRRHAAHL
jgi:hypothetical protein